MSRDELPATSDERLCMRCGKPVECEPDYPADVQVACGDCIAAQLGKPHVVVWDFGTCAACGEGRWHVITIPQLSTGLQFPQFGTCDHCLHRLDLRDLPPFMPEHDDPTGDMIEHEPGQG